MNTSILGLLLAGAMGVGIRVALDQLMPMGAWTTLVINAAGSLIAGVCVSLVAPGVLTENMRLIIVSGFCGGLTTFSALSVQSLHLLSSGQLFTGLAYALGSPIAGIIAAMIGTKFASFFL